MKKLVLSIVIALTSITTFAQRDGRVIKVENFDIYKNPIVLSAKAQDVRIFDFKIRKAIKQKITYWGVCEDNDRKSVEKGTRPCVKTDYVREKVAAMKLRYDVKTAFYRRGEIEYRMVTKRSVINVAINTLPVDAVEMLKDRRIIFPNRDAYRELARDLFTVESEMTRSGMMVKANRN
tara:strand:+ start:56959 stop:57492 length:534 start_codon:yes stop_codon:yes gene_type:complete